MTDRPDVSDGLADLVAAAADEFRSRLARGERPEPGEYAARHPEAADLLRRVLGRFRPPVGAGDRLGDFRILMEVGRGGMGVVFEAEQVSLGRRVALKLLSAAAVGNPTAVQRFQNEARAAAGLDHPHMVKVYAVGYDAGVHYIAFQFIPGRSLEKLIAELGDTAPAAGGTVRTSPTVGGTTLSAGPADPAHFRRAAGWVADAADALEHAHSLGVVHRDVKPGNLLVDAAGVVYVADFGLAQIAADPGLTATGDLLGTPRYMSPEQAEARHNLVDHRTDVYALGATLYELLTGRPAVPGASRAEVLRRIAADDPVPPRKVNPAVPTDLETVCLKCLEKDPARRYQSARELADDLRRWLADQPIRARPLNRRQRAARWASRRPKTVAAAAAALVVALTVGWWADRQRFQAEEIAEQSVTAAEALKAQGRLVEALAVIQRGVDRLPTWGSPRLRRRVTDLAADLTLLNRLEEARQSEASIGFFGGYDDTAAAREFRQTFQEAGLNVLDGDEGQVVASLGRRSIRTELTAALDCWALGATDPAERERLERIVAALDREEGGLLARARQAAEAQDAAAFRQLIAGAEADPPPPAVLNRLALRYNPEKAVGPRPLVSAAEMESLFRAGQQRYPGDFWLNNHLCSYLVLQGRTDEALPFAQAAAAVRPASASTQVTVAWLLYKQRRYPESITLMRRMVGIHPNCAQAYLILGFNLFRLGRFAEAEGAYKEAIRSKPELALAHCHLAGALIRQGRYAEAEAPSRAAIRLEPKIADARFNLADVLCNFGRLEEAVTALDGEIRVNPGNVEAYRFLGWIHRTLGQTEKAEVTCREGLRRNPNHAVLHFTLGLALYDQNRFREAEAAYREAFRLAPDHAEAMCQLGRLLHEQGRLVEALQLLRRGHELGSAQPNWHLATAEWIREVEQDLARKYMGDPVPEIAPYPRPIKPDAMRK